MQPRLLQWLQCTSCLPRSVLHCYSVLCVRLLIVVQQVMLVVLIVERIAVWICVNMWFNQYQLSNGVEQSTNKKVTNCNCVFFRRQRVFQLNSMWSLLYLHKPTWKLLLHVSAGLCTNRSSPSTQRDQRLHWYLQTFFLLISPDKSCHLVFLKSMSFVDFDFQFVYFYRY